MSPEQSTPARDAPPQTYGTPRYESAASTAMLALEFGGGAGKAWFGIVGACWAIVVGAALSCALRSAVSWAVTSASAEAISFEIFEPSAVRFDFSLARRDASAW